MKLDVYKTRVLDLIQFQGGEKVLVLNENGNCISEHLRKLGCEVDCETKTEKNHFDIIILFGIPDLRNEINSFFLESIIKYLADMLKKDGKILWCVDNKFGLKYWSGKQSEKGGFFRTIEGKNILDVQAISYSELKELLECADAMNSRIFFPYPDYRYPIEIYSDAWKPSEFDLENYRYNFDNFGYQFFDERKVWSSIIKEGLFEEFSNSYIILLEGH